MTAARAVAVTPRIALDPGEFRWQFVAASGPGGQNVNKVATAAQLRWDVRRSPSLPDDVRARVERLAGRRLTRDGVLVIEARRHRTQERNREDALERLVALVRNAAVPPVARRPTRVSFGEKRRRLDAKGRRSATKRLRDRPDEA